MENDKRENRAAPLFENLSIANLKGEWQDRVYRKDENGQELLVLDTGWQKNLIVNKAGELIAALLKGEGGISGISQHAIGHGDPAWDAMTPIPLPAMSDTTLYDEYFRKVPDSILFIDGAGSVTSSITNTIQITTTLDYTDSGANGSIREQGLFGGDASGTLDSGFMIDAIRHYEIYKDSGTKIIRRIRLKFLG